MENLPSQAKPISLFTEPLKPFPSVLSFGVREVTLEFLGFTASVVWSQISSTWVTCSCARVWTETELPTVYLAGTVSFGIPRLICASFGITQLICASFKITRLIRASFGITRLICASFGITRLIVYPWGSLDCKGNVRGRPTRGKKDA
ncbi:hypothetical protein E5676_scaffold409G002010 [Cucumis melo var. makuwa]|uniref:Uncharacterized protein n=1 Tax=Cucumis melo var. makuwa TaxID=1194695 RepID=A0A5A7U9Y5_CUCMM|nr:hypothetical protein E6C27_scaffold60G004740 [Cucumis melo var. makuwa]TYK04568.1 hypothetical protein E5676_scaffold409G002010 [Cucumis melo var. makuwa]